MVKGAALFLQQGGNAQEPKTPTHHKHAGRNKWNHIRSFLLLFFFFCPYPFYKQASDKRIIVPSPLSGLVCFYSKPCWELLPFFFFGVTWSDLQLNSRDAKVISMELKPFANSSLKKYRGLEMRLKETFKRPAAIIMQRMTHLCALYFIFFADLMPFYVIYGLQHYCSPVETGVIWGHGQKNPIVQHS